MCAGAILHFRIEEVVFGVRESKFGGVCSRTNLFDINGLNHYVKYREGIKSEEIAALMQNFFRCIRLKT
jgi:tRNA(adenine34) deaminase